MNLSTYTSTVQGLLGDPSGARFTPALVANGLRSALKIFSTSVPLVNRLDFTITSSGPSQHVASVTKLDVLLQVFYPYEPTVELASQLQNVPPYSAHFNGSCLELSLTGLPTPRVGQHIFLLYTTTHTINGLDGATLTSVDPEHELLICDGAAGFAAMLRASAIAEGFGKRQEDYDNLMKLSDKYLKSFYASLAGLSLAHPPFSALPPTGWRIEEG